MTISMETDDPQARGRIVTQNPSLLALLRDNTMERDEQSRGHGNHRHGNNPHSVGHPLPGGHHGNHPSGGHHGNHPPSGGQVGSGVRRVYVDSPVSSRADEEYQFVDPDVDSLDESQDYDRRDPVHDTQGSGRYEDRNDDQPYRSPPPRPQHTQYVMRAKHDSASREQPSPQYTHTQQRAPEPAAPRVIKPIQSPLSRSTQLANKEEQDELAALRQEQEYQQQLREKIIEQSKRNENIQIPRLDLDTLEEDDKPKPELHPLHDSLEDEYIVGDSLEERHAKSALYKAQQQLQQLQQQQLQTQQQLQQLQQQQEHILVQPQQTAGYVQDSLEVPSGGMAQYYEPATGHYDDVHNAAAAMDSSQYYGGQPQYAEQQGHDNGAHGYTDASHGYGIGYYGAENQGDPNSQGHYGYDPVAQAGGAEHDQYVPGNEVGNHGYTGPAETDPRSPGNPSSVSPQHIQTTANTSPRHDYIKENKQALTTGQPKSTYKKLFSSKKELKNRPPVAPKRKTQAPHQAEVSDSASLPQSAENLWAQRSHKLEQKKQQKLTNTRAKGTLKKYPSESGMNNIPRDSAASIRSGPAVYGGGKVPHHVQPIPVPRVPPPRQSIAEPIRSQMQRQSPDQPIRHTIVTEDGQHLSVDINLKVLSPSPQPGHAHNPPQAPPTLYQQNPAAFRQHVPRPNQRAVAGQQESPLSPQQQHIPAGHYGNPVANYGNPVVNHGPPTDHYGNPAFNYGNPAGNHGNSALNFSQPPSSYGNSAGSYGQPTGYGAQPQTASGYEMEDEYIHQYDVNSPHTISPHPSQQSTTPINSPYKVLPPIGSADTDQGRSEVRKPGAGGNNPGSYMAQYKHQRNKKQEYTEYTLDDYRKLKKEISLGGLGPDVDNETIKEKRDKRQRQLEYAKSLKQRPPGLSPGKQNTQTPQDTDEDDSLDRRRIALEYAKSVPKPKPKPRHVSHDRSSGVSSHNSGASHPASSHKPEHYQATNHKPELEVFDLEKLRQRHEKERQQVSMMRQNLENFSQA